MKKSHALLLIVITACAETGERDVVPSEANRRELADLGIARVTIEGSAHLLYDATGAQVGRVTTSARGVDVALHDATARTEMLDGARTITCNGAGITLAGDGTLATADVAALAPCRDALEVSALVLDDHLPRTSGPALLAECTLDWIIGCIDWNIDDGCRLWETCSIMTCPDKASWYCTIDGY